MIIRPAEYQDIPGINKLCDAHEWSHVCEQMLIDPTLVAIENKEIVGFIWATVSYSRYMAYIDYLLVKPGTKGVGSALGSGITKRLEDMCVKKILTLVAKSGSEYEPKCIQINEKNGFSLQPRLFNCFVKEVS